MVDFDKAFRKTPASFSRSISTHLRALQREGDVIMKKKLSVGLVFAIVLTLITLGAVAAAILSGKEFVEQELVPKASESSSEKWTKEELDEILRIASENGIVLPDDVLLRLRQGDGEYKETLMRIFVKVDLGFYPASWPIEDQAWYDALMVECGLLDTQTRFVPEGDEIPLEQALEIAVADIKSSFGDTVDVTDESRYRRFVEYRQMVDGDKVMPRKWYIEYEAILPTHNSYHLTIAADGTIEESRCQPGIYSGDGQQPVEWPWQITDYYRETFGHMFEWSQEVWMAFQHDMERVAEKSWFARALLRQQYGKPDALSMPMNQAIKAAIHAIAEQGPLTKAELEADYIANALYIIGASEPAWKISFAKMHQSGPYVFDLWHSEVNAYTGDVQNVVHYDPSVNNVKEAYVLYEVLEIVEKEIQEMPDNG